MHKEYKLIKDRIKYILTIHEETRNSDRSLYMHYGYMYAEDAVRNMTFGEAILSIPPAESLTRARRKLQQEFPELRSDKQVAKARMIEASKMTVEFSGQYNDDYHC